MLGVDFILYKRYLMSKKIKRCSGQPLCKKFYWSCHYHFEYTAKWDNSFHRS